MNSRPAHLPIVELSTGVYRLLLHAYPSRFRRQYGPEMAGVFLDSCLRTFRERGAPGMIELWVLTLFDLARSAIEEHARKETGMSNPNFVRLSGWAFIVGAVLFVPGAVMSISWDTAFAFGPTSPTMMTAVGLTAWLAPICLAVGLMGLRARYGHQMGALGRGILLVGAVAGGAIVIVGVLGQMFAPSSALGDTLWSVWALGWLLVLSCLFIFGILALVQRLLPRWNGLPLAAGILAPLALVVVGVATQLSALDQLRFGRTLGPAILIAGVVIMTFALILLGYALQSDAHQQEPLPA